MTLTKDEKRALSVILEHISCYNAINNKGINLPLYYIPKPTHTIEQVLSAAGDIYLDLISSEQLLSSPLYSALYKTKHIFKLFSINSEEELYQLNRYPLILSLLDFDISNTFIGINSGHTSTEEHHQNLINLTK